MKLTVSFLALAATISLATTAEADTVPATTLAVASANAAAARPARLPAQLTPQQRDQYRAIFSAIRGGRWSDAAAQLDVMPRGPLSDYARAEILTAKGSPKAELTQIEALLASSPGLPQAPQLVRMARSRGGVEVAAVPEPQKLSWLGSAPIRRRAASMSRSDIVAAQLEARILPLIKEDRPSEAEALVEDKAGQLTPDALTEWRQRVSWSYFLTGEDASARRLAALAQTGTGDWAVQADWVAGLAAWRQQDCRAAGIAFDSVGRRASDAELRAAGYYWSARADMVCKTPEKVQPKLRAAARAEETFYGLLALQAMGLKPTVDRSGDLTATDWDRLSGNSNIRVAAALAEIGELSAADETLRYHARICDSTDHAALLHLAKRLNLPTTQLWLAQNGPAGAHPGASARYPAPDWTPVGGWRVDKSLVFAHALQESRFRTDVVSPAGAYGLMQIMPAAAIDISKRRGESWSREKLTDPSTNIEYGQSHIEALRDFSGTQGLLPKVIAAYNAGPAPVRDWNARARDMGDPLLYIESIPYWETRGYVAIILRNYWMYQSQAGQQSASLKAMSQGMWPRFPGLPGATAVRLDSVSGVASAE
ncbi:soluble lytic murein transglycosylase-like protein [Sphingomonas zeicaulis]|uniref:lytic transglycosylase domain-containing protein n=1 Tax=Sphingomonas zeicaulis TaxID=1632740 RepID=UPI003D1BB3B3